MGDVLGALAVHSVVWCMPWGGEGRGGSGAEEGEEGAPIENRGPGEIELAKANSLRGAASWKKHGASIQQTLDDSEGNKYPCTS
jgi:hypothetical protein